MHFPTIKKVLAEGLHHQFNISLELNPGLNVLYGKNGRGKTTLLHILANVLELDFERFRYLTFKKITIVTHAENKLELIKTQNDQGIYLTILLNEQELGSATVQADGFSTPNLTNSEQREVRAVLGGRPVYLPAFRAILERVRSDSYGVDSSTRSEAFEHIRRGELSAIREAYGDSEFRRYVGARNDLSGHTARKTIQCREWFGPFVPIVRYPSILEVTERLSIELRDAQFETASFERRMLSEMFVDVFKALLSTDETPSDFEMEALIQRVRKALAEGERHDNELYTENIGQKLVQVVDQVKTLGDGGNGAAERRVLKLYAEMLERRNLERKSSFDKVRLFEIAVNKFLADKTLHVREDLDGRAVRGNSRNVYVETNTGRAYGLTALSSGERQVLTMLFSATRMGKIAPGLFLIDEPELSLHVDWQRIILSELMALAPDRQIIACTHSPEVGADHLEFLQNFAPSTYEMPLPALPSEGSDNILDENL